MNDVPNPAELLGRMTALQRHVGEEKKRHLELQDAGAQANVETRDKLIEQNELLKKQLTEQTEINQRLEHEFQMGAREAVITRKIAYWSLVVGITGIICSVISFFRG